MAVITTLLSVTTVLTIALTLWRDMMHYDIVQNSVKHTNLTATLRCSGLAYQPNSICYMLLSLSRRYVRATGLPSRHGNYSCTQIIVHARNSMADPNMVK